MDPIHVHLMLNHIPVLGTFFCALLLLVGMLMKNRTVETVALVTLLATALTSVPVYLSGEEAEHAVENLSDMSEWELEEHEEHAETSLWLVLGTGLLALLTIFGYSKNLPIVKWVRLLTLVVCVLTFLSMIPLALHGGKIMHSELRMDSKSKPNDQDDR